jgi:hypothetical protein
VFTVRYELDPYVYFRFIFAFKGLQESVLPFMFIYCSCKPNVTKIIVLQVT